MVKFFTLVLFLFVPLAGQSRGFDIIAYGSNNATTSSELVLILEELVQENPDQVKIVSIKEGFGYRKKSHYFVPEDADLRLNPEALNLSFRGEKSDSSWVFESARSYLIAPGGTPDFIIDWIRSKKNAVSSLNSNTRYWNDLTTYKAKSFLSGSLETYELSDPYSQADTQWKVAPYMEYALRFKGELYKFRVIPKSYGGLNRLISTLKAKAKPDSILISSGNVLHDERERYNLIGQFFKDHKNAFIVPSITEIENLAQADVDEVMAKINSERSLSLNVCLLKGETCEPLFKPYSTVQVGAQKIAVVGLTSPELQPDIEKFVINLPKLKNVTVKTPEQIGLESFILKIRQEHDFVVLATNMTPGAVEKYLGDFVGADFLIYRDSRKFVWKQVSENKIKAYRERSPLHFLQRFDASATHISVARIKVSNKSITIRSEKHVLDQSRPSGAELNDVYPQDFINDFFNKNYVLPDHRVLYPDKLIARKTEFALMCAQLLKIGFNAEVGVSSIQNQNSTVIGNQDERGVRTWLNQNDSVQIVYMTGSNLKKLYELNQQLTGDEKLAFFGLSSDYKINGLSVGEREVYRVVMPQTVAMASRYGIQGAPVIGSFSIDEKGQYVDSENGNSVSVSSFIITELKNHWARYTSDRKSNIKQVDTYKRLFEGLPIEQVSGYWTHSLDNLSLEYSQLTTTDASAFAAVQDSRLKSVDQRYFAANVNYKASYNKYPFVNELGLSARYSKLELFPSGSPSVINILDDQLRVFGNISAPIYSIEKNQWLGREYGPFLEVAYFTEFEADSTASLERRVEGLAGLKFFKGDFIRTASAALTTNNYLTDTDNRNVLGFNVKAEATRNVFSEKIQYKLGTEYTYFFNDDSPSADLRSRFLLDQSLNMNVVTKVTFGPYLRYFSLTRRSVDEAVNQTIIGINLTYTDFWKPKYQSSYR